MRFVKPANLPVPGLVLLVPTTINPGSSPAISGKVLEVGLYLQLTEGVKVEPGFSCLAFKAV
jgi:hypothetical protein